MENEGIIDVLSNIVTSSLKELNLNMAVTMWSSQLSDVNPKSIWTLLTIAYKFKKRYVISLSYIQRYKTTNHIVLASSTTYHFGGEYFFHGWNWKHKSLQHAVDE